MSKLHELHPPARDETGRPLEHWEARTLGKPCKGCGQAFKRRARAERYCGECRARGLGWAGRKQGSDEVASREGWCYWHYRNVALGRGKSIRFRAFGDLTRGDLLLLTERRRESAFGGFGESRRFALREAEVFSLLADVLLFRGAATVASLAKSDVSGVYRSVGGVGGRVGRQRAA